MTIRIDNISVLGTGVLGSQIAYQTAYSGLEVIAYDINDKVLDTARKRVEGLAARLEQEVAGVRRTRAGRVGSHQIFVESRRRRSRRGSRDRGGGRASRR